MRLIPGLSAALARVGFEPLVLAALRSRVRGSGSAPGFSPARSAGRTRASCAALWRVTVDAQVGISLKQSGMHWTVAGANKVIALRCYIMSNSWADFWEQQACAA